jgi:hypothetical protein
MDLLKLVGAWIAFDGAVSIIIYRQQTLKEHVIRVVRILAGLAVALFA